MLLTEWNIEDAKEVWMEEAEARGEAKQQKKIAKKALLKGAPL